MMSYFLDYDDISWLTQLDSGASNFDITTNFMERNDQDLAISLEDPVDDGRIEIYQGVYAENISDDEAIDSL